MPADNTQQQALRALLDNPDLWKMASVPRKGPVLPGEFSKDMLDIGARVAIPWELGTRAYAGANKALEGLKALGSPQSIDLAAEAFNKYVRNFAR